MRHLFWLAAVIVYAILISVFRDMGRMGKLPHLADDLAILLLSFAFLLGSAVYFAIDRLIGDK